MILIVLFNRLFQPYRIQVMICVKTFLQYCLEAFLRSSHELWELKETQLERRITKLTGNKMPILFGHSLVNLFTLFHSFA